jgi:dTDP-4-dehydrorhamnose 3,5-epimerase
MKFIKLPFAGNVFIIELEMHEDHRGLFARTVCADEFRSIGLNSSFIQQSISFNPKKGTLRGMHWQALPFGEEKLVRVTRGSIFDVVVDINPKSKTFKKSFSVELSQENRKQIYISDGYAHGFQTLESNTEVHYEMTCNYRPEASRGFIWNDPSVGISWPIRENIIMSQTDLGFSNLDDSILE